MRKRTMFIWFCVVIAAAYGLYEVKWEVRELREQNLLTEAEMLKEQRALEVLAAEWAYLTRPERLEKLARKHLPELVSGHGTQVAELQEFPPKPIEKPVMDGGLTYSSYLISEE